MLKIAISMLDGCQSRAMPCSSRGGFVFMRWRRLIWRRGAIKAYEAVCHAGLGCARKGVAWALCPLLVT